MAHPKRRQSKTRTLKRRTHDKAVAPTLAELDFEELMKVSRETHTLLEINNHSMAPIRHKTAYKDS